MGQTDFINEALPPPTDCMLAIDQCTFLLHFTL